MQIEVLVFICEIVEEFDIVVIYIMYDFVVVVQMVDKVKVMLKGDEVEEVEMCKMLFDL